MKVKLTKPSKANVGFTSKINEVEYTFYTRADYPAGAVVEFLPKKSLLSTYFQETKPSQSIEIVEEEYKPEKIVSAVVKDIKKIGI